MINNKIHTKKMKKLLIFCVGLLTAASAMSQTPQEVKKEVDCGKSVTIKATAKPGYRFVKWDDDNTENPRTISDIKEAKNYKAIFAMNNVDFGEGVTLDPAIPVVGQPLKLTAKSLDDCEEFDQWSDGNTDNPRTITYTGEETFKVGYKIKKFFVNVTSDDETYGTVEVSVVTE